jgi:hypothetical protein
MMTTVVTESYVFKEKIDDRTINDMEKQITSIIDRLKSNCIDDDPDQLENKMIDLIFDAEKNHLYDFLLGGTLHTIQSNRPSLHEKYIARINASNIVKISEKILYTITSFNIKIKHKSFNQYIKDSLNDININSRASHISFFFRIMDYVQNDNVINHALLHPLLDNLLILLENFVTIFCESICNEIVDHGNTSTSNNIDDFFAVYDLVVECIFNIKNKYMKRKNSLSWLIELTLVEFFYHNLRDDLMPEYCDDNAVASSFEVKDTIMRTTSYIVQKIVKLLCTIIKKSNRNEIDKFNSVQYLLTIFCRDIHPIYNTNQSIEYIFNEFEIDDEIIIETISRCYNYFNEDFVIRDDIIKIIYNKYPISHQYIIETVKIIIMYCFSIHNDYVKKIYIDHIKWLIENNLLNRKYICEMYMTHSNEIDNNNMCLSCLNDTKWTIDICDHSMCKHCFIELIFCNLIDNKTDETDYCPHCKLTKSKPIFD